jgi:hypothetical protein
LKEEIMDNVSSMDGLADAIDEAWESGEIRGSERSEPTGRAVSDPMAAAVDISAYELARERGPEAEERARRSGDTELAALAVESHEDYTYELEMMERGIPEELWEDSEFAAYVVDAEGDVDVAAERWDANIDQQYDEAAAIDAAQYDEAMGHVAQAVANGEVNFYDLPWELQQAVTTWAEEAQTAAAIEDFNNMQDAEQLRQAQQLVSYGALVAEEGGNVAVYEELVEQGFDVETAANTALQAGAGGPLQLRGDDGMNAAVNGLHSDVVGTASGQLYRDLRETYGGRS